jgi:hypothetical protein
MTCPPVWWFGCRCCCKCRDCGDDVVHVILLYYNGLAVICLRVQKNPLLAGAGWLCGNVPVSAYSCSRHDGITAALATIMADVAENRFMILLRDRMQPVNLSRRDCQAESGSGCENRQQLSAVIKTAFSDTIMLNKEGDTAISGPKGQERKPDRVFVTAQSTTGAGRRQKKAARGQPLVS